MRANRIQQMLGAMRSRDNFTDKTKLEIAGRAGYMCSFPGCARMTIGPSEDRAGGVTMVGDAAHIAAAAAGGERYDPSQSRDERRSAANGIWMCRIHSKWIDDNPSQATVEKLFEWKAQHEEEISAWVAHGHAGIFESWERLAALTRDQRDTIETALPNGHIIVRDGATLLATISEARSCLVSGDSGIGKSALVEVVLDGHFPDARQVWLGPEALRDSLSEASRGALGLTAPLRDILATSTSPQNFLVLDAVERADSQTIGRLLQLVTHLAAPAPEGQPRWIVIAIGQQSGFEGHLEPLVSALDRNVISLLALEPGQVRGALESVPELAQHAYDDAFVALLGNIRTLGWIIGAAPLFAKAATGRLAARTHIADRLWSHWTADDPELHSFMVRLARRDAEYERSFAWSDLSAQDQAAWKAGRQRLPMVLNERRALSFEHDLASDWARYQYLKEISRDVARWAALASQPLWVAALRLFGQYLLREPNQQKDGWDWAYAAAQAAKATDAVDVLLDALCLDPFADRFLGQRTVLLFADRAKLLKRLITRFLHASTTPERTLRNAPDSGVRLYAEAQMRSPLWTAWPPVLKFLAENRAEIGAFGSTTIAQLCEMWLAKAPTHIGGNPVIWRGEISELALETARVHQIASIAHATHGGHSDRYRGLFTAALAGAGDRPQAVSQFALEMARRRPLSPETQARIDVIREEERKRRAKAAAQQPRRQRSHAITSLGGPRKLPPWPLGPSGRLDRGFREAVLKGGALNAMFECAPQVAAEVLIACLVDDHPHEAMSGMQIDWSLGLQHDHDDQPTIFWKSPFLPFLLHASDQALEALLRLTDFCTERWVSEAGDDAPPAIVLQGGGRARSYAGDRSLLDWSHARSAAHSHFYSALDALERWLWLKLQKGEAIDTLCTHLLDNSRSAAIIGILANCAKYRPEMLDGALAPLLASPTLILRDALRIGHRWGSPDWFAWHRAGEAARLIAQQWEQAPHRSATLKQIIRDRRRDSPEFDAAAGKAFAAWPESEPAMALRHRALLAELDPRCWREVEVDGKKRWEIRYPPDVQAEIDAMQDAEAPQLSASLLLERLEAMLGEDLPDHDAAELYGAFDDADLRAAFDGEERYAIETAVAALLVIRAPRWVTNNREVEARVTAMLRRPVAADAQTGTGMPESADIGRSLIWAALAAVHARAGGIGSATTWDEIISYALATGNAGVIRTVITAARGLRKRLGAIWWRIVELAVLAATLDALRPRIDGDPGSAEQVGRWRARLARQSLTRPALLDRIDLAGLAKRVERLWLARFRRASGKPGKPQHWRGQRRRYSLGLSTHLLSATFDWALEQDVAPPVAARAEHRQILSKLLSFVEWRLRDDPYEQLDEHDGFDRLDDFGLSVIRTLAARIPLGSVEESRPLWQPVLALGPRGEFTLEHLIDCFFLRLYKDADPAKFAANWESMLAFVFAPGWLKGGRWFKGRSILQHMLGIQASHQIAHCPPVMAKVSELTGYFEGFAAEHLPHDDLAVRDFAYFLASQAGSALRLSGIQWIDAALAQDDRALPERTSSALAELVNLLLLEHASELVAQKAARKALLNVIGRMVRDLAPLALTLQDRARSLR